MGNSLFLVLLRQQMLIALIPIILIGGVAYQILFPRLNEELIQNRQSLALSVSGQVTAQFKAAEDHLTIIAMDIVNNPNSAQLSNRLDGFVQVSDIFETVYVTNANGRISHIGLAVDKVDTRNLFIDMDISFTKLDEDSKAQSKFQWSNIFVSPITGEQSVAVITRFGTTYLIAEIHLQQLPSIAAQLSTDDILVMLLDSKATIIAHPDVDISRQQISLGFAPIFTENRQQLRTGSFFWNKQEFQVTVVPLPKTRWQVAIAQPMNSYNAVTRYLTLTWLFLAAITFVITVFVAYRSALSQSRTFKELQSMTKKISSGTYDLTHIESAIEEYQAVSDAFLTMAEQIKTREKELTELNVQLEGRVEDRTSELLVINEELTNSVLRLETTMEQLVQSEKLASLGSLVAGIAHELNTPIGNAKIAVSSQLDYIRDVNIAIENNQLTKTRLNQFFEDIHSTADMAFRNMARATDLIRSFKQVAVDQTSSSLRTFNLATVINEVLVTLGPSIKRLPVKVEMQVPANIDMHSMPGSISQVLTNLINNAIFHGIEDKSKIIITLNAQVSNDRVLLIVSDTGVGMPEENIRRAFDPFFTTKMGQGGSGLGLNIVHRMVTSMLKGNIELTSVRGEGTTVTLDLPLNINASD